MVSSQAKALLYLPAPSNPITHESRSDPPPLYLEVQDSGAFSASGLSPTEYRISLRAEGLVWQYRPVTLKPGETFDLGTVVLERPRRITFSYRVVVSPPFSQAPTLEQTVLADERFRVNKAQAPGYSLNFKQQNGEIQFGFPREARIGDLGPGTLDDFLLVDPGSVSFTAPHNMRPQHGHVYLMEHRTLKHWILFQLRLEPKSPR